MNLACCHPEEYIATLMAYSRAYTGTEAARWARA